MTVPRTTSKSEHSISAVLIVKNEERKLAACLKSLDWVDEIIVLDGGSDDRSREIAEAAGARVEVRTDWEGFGAQRCRAEALATSDWILAIDADERVTPELQASIRQAITQGPAVYEVNRLCWCYGRYIRHSAMHPDWVPRLYPRGQANYDSTRVHERLRNPNNLPQRRLDGVMLHYVYDNVRHQMQKAAHYAEEWARERADRGQRGSLGSAVTHSLFCFLRMYLLRRGFLDGRAGFLLAMLMSHATFAKYAELWVLTRQAGSEEPSRHE
ncbi:glycosyltransferase family 2 protein [Marinimicrobium sp. ABcell2]|uniref:glycosyltransferase family 2 protein n=1 Tax=Marinimicrobium sp. ABcell2 TaxID=3069751 RepID=UPI0027B5730A|nr:glycosyltransferase family 2 protein [Marinimicrobium sp. ABcell2]MDQ2076528.1 glycosyltransferase family 2 protein [Marinimicrobium sp. ABcell2]